jgi:hypothetical protein
MKPGKQGDRGQSRRFEPPTVARSGAVVKVDFGKPVDRLTTAEVAELRQLLAEFKVIKTACPVARRALDLD